MIPRHLEHVRVVSRPTNWTLLGPSLLLGTLAACSPGQQGGVLVIADTLESGRVMVNVPADPIGVGPAYRLVEEFRIGSLDGDGPDLFGEIRDIELGPGGEVVILDAQASEVRVFSGTGDHLLSFGIEGEGPGELRRPGGVAFSPAGQLWVMNSGNGRYSAFDLKTGQLVREVRRSIAFSMLPWPGIIDSEGRPVDVGLDERGDYAVLRLDTAFVPQDTAAMPRTADEYQIAFRRNGMMVMSTMDPFAPQPAWAPRPNGGIVVGEGLAYRIHWIEFGGDTTRTLVVTRERVRVTATERDSALASFERMAEFSGGVPPERDPRVPDFKAAHGGLFIDDRDRVWIRALAIENVTWDVYDADGTPLGFVRLPSPVRGGTAVVRNGRLAVSTLVDGVPTVILYRLAESDRAESDRLK